MTTRQRLRVARRRAASALTTYLEERTPASERALIDATHELERVTYRRRHEARSAQLVRAVAAR